MITATFIFGEDDLVRAFDISGHAGYGEEGFDIICSAVSSAVYMTVNALTDVIFVHPQLSIEDGETNVTLSQEDAEKGRVLTSSLYLHLKELEKDYPEFIKLERGAL